MRQSSVTFANVWWKAVRNISCWTPCSRCSKTRDGGPARGRQRTDSTHVLAKIRALNRLVCVGETLRAALNSLAIAAPEWTMEHSDPAWVHRYGPDRRGQALSSRSG